MRLHKPTSPNELKASALCRLPRYGHEKSTTTKKPHSYWGGLIFSAYGDNSKSVFRIVPNNSK